MVVPPRLSSILMGVALLSGCGVGVPDGETSRPQQRVLFDFVGVVDPGTGRFEIQPVQGTNSQGLSVLPVVQNGVPNAGPANTLELVTSSLDLGPDCGGEIAATCADVTARFFGQGQVISNLFMEVTSIVPPIGHDMRNSVTVVPPEAIDDLGQPLSNTLGLIQYGGPGRSLGTVVSGSNGLMMTWIFGAPTTAPFSFNGSLWGAVSDLSDYQIDVDVSTTDNDAIGIMFRVVDSNNYYRWSNDIQRNYQRLVKVTNGVFSEIAAGQVRDPAITGNGPSVPVQIVANGSSIIVNVGGVERWNVTDTDHASGNVALYCWGNQVSEYDNVVVTDLGTGANILDVDDGDMTGWVVTDQGTVATPSAWTTANGRFEQTSNIYSGSASSALPIDKLGTYLEFIF